MQCYPMNVHLFLAATCYSRWLTRMCILAVTFYSLVPIGFKYQLFNSERSAILLHVMPIELFENEPMRHTAVSN